ncbi:unknown protein [Arabidopsis thaliana]|uniref:F26K24.8 protein n=1 Tax=Arabidopsis thaliana TaxID=3702 RepID=Q9SF19_ARATH|nr:unknown protein [Arabidopsis thaliana]
MRTNRAETGGTRGIDGKECDLIDFRSEHGDLRVSVEREMAMIAGRVLNGFGSICTEERIFRSEGNAESESIADRNSRI